MNQSPEINELAAALAAFQAEMPSVPKTHTAEIPTKTGGKYAYKYADLADTVEAASKLLAKQGLSVSQAPEIEDGRDMLTTLVMHKSGQWLKFTTPLFLAKEDPQSHGSAITYARRYAYCAALGIVADEDDDGAAATHAHPAAARTTRRRPAPQTVTEITPKRRLLQACGGDVKMAERMWEEAFGALGTESPEKGLTETELQLLLSRAQAEMERADDGRPM